ncbi:MAG: hypothetical protein IJ155_12450 [Prevotella sp.]|nr:hypothetical protein [Prevotella sp.]
MKRTVILQLLVLFAASTAMAQGNKNFREDFEAFKKGAKQEYSDFRKKALAEYAEYVRQAWKEYGAEPPREMPQVKEVEPMLVPDADEKTESWFSKIFGKRKNADKDKDKKAKDKKPAARQPLQDNALKYTKVIEPAPLVEQPKPLSEVVQQPEKANDYYSFSVFGTEYRVRIGDNCRFTLNSVKEDEIADIIKNEFLKPQFDNMLYDCLQERKNHSLSDWAYYQMLAGLTNSYYGENSNIGVLVMGYLYTQSGYKARMAQDGTNLYLLVSSRHYIYNASFYYVDGEWYYLLDGRKSDKLAICAAKFPNESSLSLQISAVQKLSANPTSQRTITSEKNSEFSFTLSSNKNYIDFYDTYPTSTIGDNFMTKWTMYAETPLEEGIRQQLYPAIQQKIAGLSPKDAVQQLLWWVQTGLEYGYDDQIWGGDRPFFGEESLFYPYCDCEDRAILLSHLVRELVHLDVILVYYPGHLAMAVNFPNDDVAGDHIMHNGQKFIVCDPTYIGARIGETMPMVQGEDVTVIKLRRS